MSKVPTHGFLRTALFVTVAWAASVFFAPFPLRAQVPAGGAGPAPNVAPVRRITQPVDESALTILRGNTHPLARPQNDQGAVADAQPVQRALLLLRRSADQEAALRALLDQQQDASSPNYHRWLTPQQFGAQFGPADADVQAVTDWLASHGFQVNRVSAGRTVIEFSGNAGQVRDAFHTEIHRYAANGQQHFANNADPQIPLALAPVVAGPVSLNDFGRKAFSKIAGLVAAARPAGSPQPALTSNCTSNGGAPFTCYVVAPSDFATIYNSQSLWNSTPSIDGTNQTIAIVGDSNINCADVKNFRLAFGLPVSTPTNNNDCTQATSNVQVILDGPDPGITPDEIEADLDVQWSGAVAKGAHVDFVTSETTDVSAGVDLSAEYIVDNDLAPVMSESFGACELTLGGGSEFYEVLWEQAAAEGITVIASTGDSGAAGCDDDNTQAVSVGGLAVSGLASTPFNVAVGGTDFNDFNNQTNFWNNSNSVNGQSVKGYVPEIPWDDSCAASSVTGCNGVTITGAPASLNIVGGGGGQSNCVTQTALGACSAGFAKPAWQAGSAVTGSANTDGVRDLPDVSLFAAAGSGSNSFYPICSADQGGTCTGANFSFIGVGGTSSSAPAFAGIMAMVNQYMGTQGKPTKQGNANYVLYSMASKQVNSPPTGGCNSTSSPNTASTTGCTFYDITQGSNSMPCLTDTGSALFNVSGTGLGCTINNVNANTPGVLTTNGSPSGTLAWQAGTGYDLSSGLGSVNAFNLAHNWPAAATFMPTSTTLQLCTGGSPSLGCSSTSISITHGAQVFVDATVSPSPGSSAITNFTVTKGEDIALIGTPNTTSNNGGSTASAADRFSVSNGQLNNVDIYPLTSGSTSGEGTNFLVGGTYAVVAHYTGDGTFGASDSPGVSVNVSAENSTTTMTFVGAIDPGTGNTVNSTAYGLPDIFRVDVVGVSSGEETATGNVTITDNGTVFGGLGCCTLNSEGHLDLEPGINLVPTLSTIAHSFLASYQGDASYSASATAAPFAFAITPAATSTGVTSSSTSVASGTVVTLTATVSPDSIGVAPAGTVTFFANATPIATGSVSYTPTNGSFFGPPQGNGTVFASLVAKLNYTVAASTTITAMYNGGTGVDPNYASSGLSSGVNITVSATPTFSISSPNNSAGNAVAIAAPGGTATSQLTVSSLNSFSGTVTLTCSVTPTGETDEPTCSFPGSNTVNLTANASQMPTVMLNTTAVSFAPRSPAGTKPTVLPTTLPFAWIIAVLLAALALLSSAVLPKSRRGYGWLVVLLLAAAGAAVACGSSSSGGGGNNSNPGTTTGVYTVTVSGTSGPTMATPAPVFFNLQ